MYAIAAALGACDGTIGGVGSGLGRPSAGGGSAGDPASGRVGLGLAARVAGANGARRDRRIRAGDSLDQPLRGRDIGVTGGVTGFRPLPFASSTNRVARAWQALTRSTKRGRFPAEIGWSNGGSNPGPPHCERGALPAELLPQTGLKTRAEHTRHPAEVKHGSALASGDAAARVSRTTTAFGTRHR